MQASVVAREFTFNGVKTPDLDKSLSPEGRPIGVGDLVAGHRHRFDHETRGHRRQTSVQLRSRHRRQGVTSHEPEAQKGGSETGGPWQVRAVSRGPPASKPDPDREVRTMHRLSKRDTAFDRGAGGDGTLAKRIIPVAAARLASAPALMGTGDQLSIPRLEGVPLEYLHSAGDSALIPLARTLVELDLAAPEDWESAHRDPGAYVLRTIERRIAAHGGAAIRRRFDLYATLGSDLDEYSDENQENPDGTQLYLTVDPDHCGFVVLGPTLELLEKPIRACRRPFIACSWALW